MSVPRYLEDLTVGERRTTGLIEITEAECLAFASRYDPQSMHTDAAAALDGPLHGLSASGWHTTALAMRLIIDAQPLGGEPILGLGVDDLRWPAPVRPGDTIQAELEILSITPSRSRPSHGVVRIKTTVRNQAGHVVLSMIPILWVPRRPAY